MNIKYKSVQGEELVPWLPSLADLRIKIFREFPYLYEGDLNYEKKYLARYASARSVELCCSVIVSHLIGKTNNDLVDINIGNHHQFLPSQSLFGDEQRFSQLEALDRGEVIKKFTVPIQKIRDQRKIKDESNPVL